tara:strand:- start:1694 stop:3292 length:1599 start_codon:yes stop_codon:yes gene_type:complete
MYQQNVASSPSYPPEGIGSFLTSNLDEIPDNVIAFGQSSGINSMGNVADRMAQLAQMGRNGDTELAHVNRDEIIIDRNMARDPRIRNAVAEVFRDNDLDLARYTVGNAANSINPYTGQREFFLKKLVRGAKKIAKGVMKVVKAAAPIVIPAVMNVMFPGMGAIASGFVGSGITSLAMGNNFKDSLKAGLMGGAMGGIMQGFKNYSSGGKFLSPEGQFTGSKNFGMFERNRAKIGDQYNEVLSRLGIGDGAKDGPGYVTSGKTDTLGFNPEVARAEGFQPQEYSFKNLYDVPVIDSANTAAEKSGAYIDANNPVLEQGRQPPVELPEDDGMFSFKRAEMSPADQRKYLMQAGYKPENQDVFNAQLKNLSNKYDGGYKLAKLAGVTALAAPFSGLLDPIPQDEPPEPFGGVTAEELLAANPEAYRSGIAQSPYRRANMTDIMVETPSAGLDPLYQQYLFPQQAAAGGEMQNFPRRTGYIGGPGTETSDSIPAMLSDGEFVMNAKAVRGAGGGSRERGVRKMYDMMRAFEGGAVA